MSENTYTFRRAKESDYSFLAQVILGADKGPGDGASSYAALFGISEDVATQAITQMMYEEMEGCEFSPLHFLVAEFEGKPVAAVSAWVEGFDGISSWVVRSALVQEYYPKGSIEHVQSVKEIADSIMVERTQGTMQLESLFVSQEHRGQRLAARLFREQAVLIAAQYPEVSTVQLMTYSDNKTAIRAYEKMGFVITDETHCDDVNVLKYFPSNGMVSMEISLENLLKI